MLLWSGFRQGLATPGKALLTGHSVQNQRSLGCDVSRPRGDAFHYTIGVFTPRNDKKSSCSQSVSSTQQLGSLMWDIWKTSFFTVLDKDAPIRKRGRNEPSVLGY